MSTDQHVFKVPSYNLGVLADKFTKLGRRAKRIGLPAPTFRELKSERVNGSNGSVYLVHHIVVDAGISEVKVGGWTFIATIQHTEEGNIVRAVGTHEVPKQYRSGSQLCEHCGYVRNRKDTYVLHNSVPDPNGKHSDKEYIQVGRSCLQDFFGHDALMYAERAQYLTDIDALGDSMEDDMGFGGGARGPRYEALEVYLGFVTECIAKDGWMSRGNASKLGLAGSATCEVAYRHLHPRQAVPSFKPFFSTPSEDSSRIATEAIEWASELEGEDIVEYLSNIRVIARRGVYEGRDMGLAASIVSAYQRHLSKLRYAERQARSAELSNYIGSIDEKIRINVTVDRVSQFEGMYGLSHINVMSDSNGNVFIWFSGTALETGKEVTIDAKVKKHNERDGVKQTILSRCTVVDMKDYYAIVEGAPLRFTAASVDEVKKLLKEKLGIKRMPKGVCICEAGD